LRSKTSQDYFKYQIKIKSNIQKLEIGNWKLEISDEGGINMDPIADMLTIIRNGYLAKKQSVLVPFSKFKLAIAKLLEREKFLGKVIKKDSKIVLELLYENQKPKVTQIQRISKLGLRIYTKSKKIKKIKAGKGLTIISTPKGLLTNKEARAKNLGGEVICQVW